MAFPRCIGVSIAFINVLFIAPLPLCRLPCDLHFQGRAENNKQTYLLQGFILRRYTNYFHFVWVKYVSCDPNCSRKKSPLIVICCCYCWCWYQLSKRTVRRSITMPLKSICFDFKVLLLTRCILPPMSYAE